MEKEEGHAPEVIIVNKVRKWCVYTLIFGFFLLLLSIYQLFYCCIDVYNNGFELDNIISLCYILMMTSISILAIAASELKTLRLTKIYFILISIYAPLHIVYSILFNTNEDLHKTLILYIVFISTNILACSMYVFCGYQLYNTTN